MINYVKNKISKSSGILFKVRNYLDKNTLKQLYYSFVYPYLIYGIEIWGNASNIHLDPINKLQKRCIRIITFSHYLDSTNPLFRKLEILNLKKIVIHRISLMMYKHSLNIVPKYISMMFQRKTMKFISITQESATHFILLWGNLKLLISLLVFMLLISGIIC